MAPNGKETIKNILGEIPYTAELYWILRQRGEAPKTRFTLKNLHVILPEISEQARALRANAKPGKKIFLFASLHYWIDSMAMLGMAFSAMGHDVTLGYLPFADYRIPINRFDLRRQNIYAQRVLQSTDGLLNSFSFLNCKRCEEALPPELKKAVEEVTVFDVQYTTEVEEVDTASPLYQMRLRRNEDAARVAWNYFHMNRPNLVVVPNGTIQEFGIVYRVAQLLKIPRVTYEFSDRKDNIWMAQNSEVMLQDTDNLWKARGSMKLTPEQFKRVHDLYAARKSARVVENFSRQWQGESSQGGEKVRRELKLDDRPVVLLPTNVLGDSLALGRQVYTKTMTEWLNRTVQYFSGRPDVQLVIRIHPGESLLKGSIGVADVIHREQPRLPEHIHIIAPRDPVNTYDLISIADLGLVYTTTVGLEMAFGGVPVIVNGKTHYRNRGFTYDPDSYVTYFKFLGTILGDPKQHRLTQDQVDEAWRYAYYFFFEYPRPYPWHLYQQATDFKLRPLDYVFSKEGQLVYGDTLKYLAGDLMDWGKIQDN